jgi:16S rRNA (guanine527-N7)-methyltransferase
LTLTASAIDATLRSYGIEPRPELADKIRAYIDLLARWNRKIALTTVSETAEIVKFHFGESMFAASRYNLEKSRLADVGTGAGFPGLPLALVVPSLELTLIESNRKKSAFLAEVIRQLAVPNIQVFTGRMESYVSDHGFDFITARAFGQFEELFAWAKVHLAAKGKMLLWLGELDSRTLASMPGWLWTAPDLIPGSKGRYILAGSPIRD